MGLRGEARGRLEVTLAPSRPTAQRPEALACSTPASPAPHPLLENLMQPLNALCRKNGHSFTHHTTLFPKPFPPCVAPAQAPRLDPDERLKAQRGGMT